MVVCTLSWGTCFDMLDDWSTLLFAVLFAVGLYFAFRLLVRLRARFAEKSSYYCVCGDSAWDRLSRRRNPPIGYNAQQSKYDSIDLNQRLDEIRSRQQALREMVGNYGALNSRQV